MAEQRPFKPFVESSILSALIFYLTITRPRLFFLFLLHLPLTPFHAPFAEIQKLTKKVRSQQMVTAPITELDSDIIR